MSCLKRFAAASALAGLAACGNHQSSEPKVSAVPVDVAYCLVDPKSDQIEIVATQTDDTMYKARRVNDDGYGNRLMTVDGTPERRVLFLTDSSCVVSGHGTALEYATVSSRLRSERAASKQGGPKASL